MAHRVHIRNNFLFAIAVATAVLVQACAHRVDDRRMPVYNAASIRIAVTNGFVTKEGQPFSGIIFSLWPGTNDTAEVVCFNRGREHGTWRRWYSNGRLMEIRAFTNGQKTGTFSAWWPNGRRKLTYHFDHGEYNGVCSEWSDSGILLQCMTYKLGYEDGRQQQFYSDGTVKANYTVINGRRYGLLGTKDCSSVGEKLPAVPISLPASPL